MVDFALCLRNLALVLSFSENIVHLESVSEFECDSTIPCPLLSTSTLSAGGVANAYTFKSHVSTVFMTARVIRSSAISSRFILALARGWLDAKCAKICRYIDTHEPYGFCRKLMFLIPHSCIWCKLFICEFAAHFVDHLMLFGELGVGCVFS